MRAEPRTILNFLCNYFDLVRDLFDTQQEEGIIKREAFQLICEKYEKDVQNQLLEYKILRKVSDDLEFHTVFFSFFEFVLSEFRPLLPETIEKYHYSITKLFRKIRERIEGDKGILTQSITDLSKEIRTFYELVGRNTVALLKETRDLKANIQKVDYREKVIRASRWIEEYILPLNKILDINHPDSIANKLYEVAQYANMRRLNFDDEGIRLSFEKLYNQLIQTNDDLLKQSKLLTHELMPLIERIRTESLILSGWIEFLKNPYRIDPPAILKVTREYPYSRNMFLNTKEFFEQFMFSDDFYLEEDEFKPEKWIYNKAIYKAKLQENLPVENFFQWCSEILKDEYKVIEMEKFFSLFGLLFEEDLSVEFSDKNKYDRIRTTTATINVPIIKVTHNGLF